MATTSKPTTTSGRKRPRKKDASTSDDGATADDTIPAATAARRDQTQPAAAVLLTPHTLRLLKLIQDGTAEHAEMAAKQLHSITSPENNCTPIVLWEIMGRLQSFLVSPEWNARLNAAVALEGVAQHLPIADQEAFLRSQTRHGLSPSSSDQGINNSHFKSDRKKLDDDDNSSKNDNGNWLQVQDVQKNVETILFKGRALYATAEDELDVEGSMEDEQIRLLTDAHQQQHQREREEGTDPDREASSVPSVSASARADTFCERRLDIQRRILARRLGLSDTILKYTTDGRDILKNGLTMDDLGLGDDNVHGKSRKTAADKKTKGKRGKKSSDKRRRKAKQAEDDYETRRSVDRKLSIGDLLVSEVCQQQALQHDDSGEDNVSTGKDLSSSATTSDHHRHSCRRSQHGNAQRLLAGELVYRMFDADWHVRHGSLMGIRALIRAWNLVCRPPPQQQESKPANVSSESYDIDGCDGGSCGGGDNVVQQSHRSSNSFGYWPHDILARVLCVIALDRFGDFSGASTESMSTSMVAPIRESAAQVFSIVFVMAPETVRNSAVKVLRSLLQCGDWEVRHGAMLALKYVLVLLTDHTTHANDGISAETFLPQVLPLAISVLEDTSDDAQSVAAQIFTVCCRSVKELPMFGSGVTALWRALSKVRPYSIAVPDLLLCMSHMVNARPDLVFETVSPRKRKIGWLHSDPGTVWPSSLQRLYFC